MAVIGSKIRQLREDAGFTQEELGKKLGVIKQTVSSWENNVSEPNSEVLSSIASIFDVSIDYLFGYDKCAIPKTHETEDGNYFFFFFDNEDLLRNIFAHRIKSAISNMGLSEDNFKTEVPIGSEKAAAFLECRGEPTANDLIELSQFLGTSIDYLLGQIPKLSSDEKKLLNSFVKLDANRKDIIVGKTKELLLQQEAASVAADEPLKKTGTTNSVK